MRTLTRILKLAVLVAVLNATAQMAIATWKNVQLKDAAQRVVLFGREQRPDFLQDELVTKAAELDLTITPDQISIAQDEVRTVIDVAYINPVEVFPNQFYSMKFSFSVEAFKTRQ
jgi:hypothetical protein